MSSGVTGTAEILAESGKREPGAHSSKERAARAARSHRSKIASQWVCACTAFAAAFVSIGLTSPWADQVMLNPLRFVWLNLGSPLKLCVEFASTNPLFEFVN